MRVIGIVGLIGSGKDTASEYIAKKYGYTPIVMGDIVRELAAKEGLEPTRENLDKLQARYTKQYGLDYFASEVIKRIKEKKLKEVIINGIRRPIDATLPKKVFGKEIIIILIDVSAKTRFERMKARKRVGDPKTLKEFLGQEESQRRHFQLDETFKYVDYKVFNEGTLEKMQKQIDELLKKIGFA